MHEEIAVTENANCISHLCYDVPSLSERRAPSRGKLYRLCLPAVVAVGDRTCEICFVPEPVVLGRFKSALHTASVIADWNAVDDDEAVIAFSRGTTEGYEGFACEDEMGGADFILLL